MNKDVLKGKVVMITGATGILGTKFCDYLASYGATIIALDLDAKVCESFANELSAKHGGDHGGFGCDITDANQVQEVVSYVGKKWGGIHVLFNNAASKGQNLNDYFAPFEDYKLETWREIMAANVDGMFLMAQAVGRLMIEKNIKGSIIQTASIYGVVAPDQRIYEGSNYLGGAINTPAIYSASKAAVVGLTKYLATYWGHKGIRVNSLTPGGVSSGQNGVFQEKYGARVPLGRMAEKEEMCGALLFLASDASSYVTGHNLVVDGGLTAW